MFENVIVFFNGKIQTTILLENRVIYIHKSGGIVTQELNPENQLEYRVHYGFGAMTLSSLEQAQDYIEVIKIECDLYVENVV